MTNLKACPNCESENVSILKWEDSGDLLGYEISCINCGMVGPDKLTELIYDSVLRALNDGHPFYTVAIRAYVSELKSDINQSRRWSKTWKRATKFLRNAIRGTLNGYNQAIHTQELICARIYERHCSEHHNADFEVCKDAMCAMVQELGFDTGTKQE
jgi:hypothetical protein